VLQEQETIVDVFKTNHLPADFEPVVRQQLDEELARYGFAHAGSELGEYWGEIHYRGGDRYLRVTVSLHYRDAPSYGTVVLGTGATTWPEADWNGVALWRLAADGTSGGMLLDGHTAEEFAEAMKVALVTHAHDYLVGDLERFRRSRADQTRGREPYKVYGSGQPSAEAKKFVDDSVQLKQRYSDGEAP
jgi:hypothetical protein